ncbi:MAG: biopolymer transport protein ExbB [Verrucomicrobiales bacterium]|jgi:biopolymer transport protein ExbB
MMRERLYTLLTESLETWQSGGWLMLPLLFLTIFIYYTALELFLRLNHHFLIRGRIHQRSDRELHQPSEPLIQQAHQLMLSEASSVEEVKRHFHDVRQTFLPLINRRIRFLAVLIPAGPLLGLLGTVTGMVSTFDGMIGQGHRMEAVSQGVSEALITTQSGLIITIPALIILSLIIQRRNLLAHGIARLERYNTKQFLLHNKQVAA